MQPKVTVITLGVSDLTHSVKFYRDQLGWPTEHKPEDGVAFFQMNGLVLSLFPRPELAKDANLPDSPASAFPGFSLAHNLSSPEEVDTVMSTAEKAGAKIIKPAQKVFWGGYSGYFADPDGFLWEVAHNPFWRMDEDGKIKIA
ncbi:VOC family protein [Candidatus Peregrinibacteria bacterium]|nr:VOC family protein [Candidatus Peregrinibacteria bacterium]